MSIEEFKETAMAFPGTEVAPHFDRTAYRVVKKRIFATSHEPSQSANILLTPTEQAEFCGLEASGIYPVPNKWGLQGWTTFELGNLPLEAVQAALELAYQAVAIKNRK